MASCGLYIYVQCAYSLTNNPQDCTVDLENICSPPNLSVYQPENIQCEGFSCCTLVGSGRNIGKPSV